MFDKRVQNGQFISSMCITRRAELQGHRGRGIQTMRGTVSFDQRVAYYKTSTKKKWQLAVITQWSTPAEHHTQRKDKNNALLDFITSVCIAWRTPCKEPARHHSHGSSNKYGPQRFVGLHVPVLIPRRQDADSSRPECRTLCVVCKENRINTFCGSCYVALCFLDVMGCAAQQSCWSKHHTNNQE